MYWFEKFMEVTWAEVLEELPGLGDQIVGRFQRGAINPAAATTFDPLNYLAFVDRDGVVCARLNDINGWNLLEAVVKRSLGIPLEPELQSHLREFGNGKLCGWWKESELQQGRPFFLERKPHVLVHDVDDTAWCLKLRRSRVTDDHLEPFLSPDTLPGLFHGLAKTHGVERRYVIRTWEHKVWHKWDCDLLCMANMISALPEHGTELQTRVFEENRKLINAAIPDLHQKLMMYYEPKMVGVCLLLLYDHAHRPFLTPASRNTLLRELQQGLDQLRREEVSSRWAGDDSVTYHWGYNLQWRNGTLPALLVRYAEHLLGEKSSSLRAEAVQ